jgi:hypothetical protein
MKKGPKPIPVVDRIMKKITINSSGCMLWNGATNGRGYGVILDDNTNGRRMTYVHIAMYVSKVGPVPSGMQLDHLCRTRNCCNPEHLEPVSGSENLLRSNNMNFVTKRTGVCKNGHNVSGINAHVSSDGRTRCRACAILRKRMYRIKNSATRQPSLMVGVKETACR